MEELEPIDEVKDRMKERLGWLIFNPGAGIKTDDNNMLVIRSSLSKPAYDIAVNYIDDHIPDEKLYEISELKNEREKAKKFDEECSDLFLRIRTFIKKTEKAADMNENWYPKIMIDNFLLF